MLNKTQQKYILDKAADALRTAYQKKIRKVQDSRNESYKEALKNKTLFVDYNLLEKTGSLQGSIRWPGYVELNSTYFDAQKTPFYLELEKKLLFSNPEEVETYFSQVDQVCHELETGN